MALNDMNQLNENSNRKATSNKAPVAKPKEMKILGIVSNISSTDTNTYYIAYDGEKYYLFVGRECTAPDNYF